MTTISHLYQNADGSWVIQENDDHLRAVAALASKFASEFGMGSWAHAIGMLHDKGKESVNFQNYIKRQSGYDSDAKCTGDHQHAYVGGVIARQLYGASSVSFFCNPIVSHHTGLHDYTDLEVILKKQIPSGVDVSYTKEQLEKPPFKGLEGKDIHHLSRMLFSCLVDADFLDTEAFMDAKTASLRGGKSTIKELLPLLDSHLKKLQESAAQTDVNAIRKQVQDLCLKESQGERGFYSLTVPTGGGKTLSSLLWAMHHAVRNGMRRIVIAIPYTSIIVQTAGQLKKIFGEENVLEHHSNFNPEDVKDECLRHKAKLATENWDYPIVVTTNVQLFESMYSNRPSDCRKLHNIANSVIILDEVQTLPVDFLQPIVDSLKTYQKIFGVSVLFTTASQPVLSGDVKGCNPKAGFPGVEVIKEIIPPSLRLHDKLRRVQLEIDNSGKTYDEVASMLSQHKRVLCIVNTRRDAKELYDRLPKDEGVTLHLSRMMCPAHVRSTIDEIKRLLNDDDCKVLRVIATQLVEAGVDIDFPVVFRQEAGLDSILQAAGRCNREGRLDMAKTYVFSLSRERNLPVGCIRQANDARLALGSDNDWFAPEVMTNYFRQLYCRRTTFDAKEMSTLLYDPKELRFAEAAKSFRLIDEKGKSVVINWGDSMEILERVKLEGINYIIMKKLSRYMVNIYERDFKTLLDYGAVEEIVEGLYVISDRAQYDEHTGLSTDNHWMEEILIM